MSNISSIMSSSSSSSSIYGSRNVLSGLASGLDTETLIENSIQAYLTKIQTLQQQQTKLIWKQDAYRTLADQLVSLSNKYTSYTSKTNLSSPSFFSNNILTTTNGTYSDLISATGKTNSDIQINAVKQLASAARYTYSADNLNGGSLTANEIDWTDTFDVSDISGSMTITYGTKAVSIDFSETDTVSSVTDLSRLIGEKLADQKITLSDGTTVAASTRIGVSVDGDSIKFTDLMNAGNSVYISGATGDLTKNSGLTIQTGTSSTLTSTLSVTDASALSHEASMAEYLSGKTISVTLDDTTKEISMGTLDSTSSVSLMDQLVSNIGAGLKSAFGDKVSVTNDDGALSFSTKYGGVSLKVSSDYGSALGITSSLTNYLNTSSSLGDLLGDKINDLDIAGYDSDGNALYSLVVNGVEVGQYTADTALESVISAINSSDAGVTAAYSSMTNKFTFTAKETGADNDITFGDGLGTALFGEPELNLVDGIIADGDGNLIEAGTTSNGTTYYIRVNDDGTYSAVDQDGNSVRDGRKPVTVTEDDITDEMRELSRKGYTAGTDAIVNVSVNGENMTLQRSSNVISMDGLSVTLKGTFNEEFYVSGNKVGIPELDENGDYIYNDSGQIRIKELSSSSVVTFTTKADADTIVDAITSFVDEFNQLMQDVHDAFSTQPLKDSSNNAYEPLTDDDKDDMTDSEIERYETKAKTGLLFGDSDLYQLYNRLRSAITPGSDSRKAMESIGLTTSYSDGVLTLSLDEDTLREALETNPDSVKSVFTGDTENGSSTDGLMTRLSKTFDAYGSTTYGSYGILVRKAGSSYSSLSQMDNTLQDQIDNYDEQIEKWQDKMSDRIDYYNNLYTQLETLMLELNNQSSALDSLMSSY